MSDKLTLAAQKRTEFGKGAARRARAAHLVPAVLYGHGTDPVHILLPGHETMLALKNPNALLTVQIGKDSELAIAKDIQRNPIKPVIEHVDLLLVRKGEKITVDVPVHVEGESAPGTIHVLENSTLQVLAEATSLPEFLTVSIEGLEDGAKVLVSDLELPEGTTFEGDPEQLVVQISVPRVEVEEEATDDAEGETAEAAEAADESAEGDE